MRPAVLWVILLSACGKDPEPAVKPPPPPPPRAGPAARADLIAFVREGNVWVIDPDGGSERQVTRLKEAGVADPAWSPGRDRIAFTAAGHPEFDLLPRNVFEIRADGTGLRQVTPMPRAGLILEDAPKGIVRGRAVLALPAEKRPVPGIRVTVYGTRAATQTAHDGTFQTYLPLGGGWVKLVGEVNGRRMSAWRYAAAIQGRPMELKDIVLLPGGEDVPACPAWTPDGKHLLYLMRHSLVDRSPETPLVTLRRIRSDGIGDESIVAPTRVSIIAGPVARGDGAWVKMSDGQIARFDLSTKAIAARFDAGIAAPDALAVSPDGSVCATLKIDETGGRALILLRDGKAETVASFRPGEASPHAFDFSPDGDRIVLDRRTAQGASDLWILDLVTRGLKPLTRNGLSSNPVWHGR